MKLQINTSLIVDVFHIIYDINSLQFNKPRLTSKLHIQVFIWKHTYTQYDNKKDNVLTISIDTTTPTDNKLFLDYKTGLHV